MKIFVWICQFLIDHKHIKLSCVTWALKCYINPLEPYITSSTTFLTTRNVYYMYIMTKLKPPSYFVVTLF